MNSDVDKPHRRWHQVSLRFLLLLILFAALAIGWWADHRRLKNEQALLEKRLEEALRNDQDMVMSFQLSNVQASDAIALIGPLFAGNPRVRVGIDPKTNKLVVRAKLSDMQSVRKLVEEIEMSSVKGTP